MAASTLGNAWLVDDGVSAPTKKRKRIAKHKKKAWRITSDITDVERFYESERLEERLGEPFSERPSDSLFVVDTAAETAEPADAQPQQHISKRTKRKDIGPLKCFAILTARSAVPDPLKKRNRVRTPAERRDPLVARVLAERRAQGKIPARFVQSMRDHAKAVEQRSMRKKPEKLRSSFDFDLWGSKGEEIVIGDAKVVQADLSEEVKKYTLERTNKRIYSRPASMYGKTSSLAPVEYPHPGTSYNPTFEDHQALLQIAHNVEVGELKKEAHVRRQLGPMTKKVPEHEREANWMSEMSQGLAEDLEGTPADAAQTDSSAPMIDGSSAEAVAAAADADADAVCVRPTKPKTLKQKRKFRLHKLREIRRLRIKDKKKRMAQVDRLRSLQRQIGKEDERRAALLVKRAKEKLRKMAQPKVLGKVKYEPPQVEVNLSEEISGSLRTLKVEGNVLLDRYKSLQRRNIIEPRLIQRVVRKYKPKKYAKHSHKDAALRFGDGGRGRGIGRDTGRPAAAGSHAARRKARKARPKH